MLIGRDEEAAKITRFLGGLAGGSRVLLIEGEAGIGKTTLLREGHVIATQLGMTVLSAFPVESEIPLEFAGLTGLLDKVPAGVIDGLPPGGLFLRVGHSCSGSTKSQEVTRSSRWS